MRNHIQGILQDAGLVGADWGQIVATRGGLVKLYREYYDGSHRLKLTTQMREMMQIADEKLDRYNANYCEMVVDAMADRLTVETIVPSSGSDMGREWAQDLQASARLDGLQIDVHEASLRDGESFVMVEYDEASGSARMVLERAYDGEWGMIPVWDSAGERMVAAVKIWETAGGETRGNIYYADRVEKYVDSGGDIRLLERVETARNGRELGVPVIRFCSRGGTKGRSELLNVIPLQDSLNRTLTSMVMSAELEAFSVLFARGFAPAQGITPGMIVIADLTDENGNMMVPTNDEQARAYSAMINSFGLERIGGGSLVELINQADFLINQIGAVSSTPLVHGDTNQSGEALKQRDVKLLGKLRRAHTRFGNAWENVMALAHQTEVLYGFTAPPVVDGWQCRWMSGEIRSDAEVVQIAETMHRWGYEREALRLLGQTTVASYSEADIDRLIDEKRADAGQTFEAMAGSLPGFTSFN